MKNLTVNDATKEELIQYFFVPEGMGGGFRIPAMKDSFLLWLNKKRNGELLTAYEQSSEAMQQSLHEYIRLIREANDEPDIEKKIAKLNEADEAYVRYEKIRKHHEKTGNRFMKEVGG